MSATSVAALISVVVAITAGYVYSIRLLVGRMDRLEDRLERLEQRLSSMEVEIARIGQRLDDHITGHPGPTERLVGPSR